MPNSGPNRAFFLCIIKLKSKLTMMSMDLLIKKNMYYLKFERFAICLIHVAQTVDYLCRKIEWFEFIAKMFNIFNFRFL